VKVSVEKSKESVGHRIADTGSTRKVKRREEASDTLSKVGGVPSTEWCIRCKERRKPITREVKSICSRERVKGEVKGKEEASNARDKVGCVRQETRKVRGKRKGERE
jgi:hypothetical protein